MISRLHHAWLQVSSRLLLGASLLCSGQHGRVAHQGQLLASEQSPCVATASSNSLKTA